MNGSVRGRYSYAQAILGDDLFKRVQDSSILCVGAGGIGCEVLKNLVECGFRQITIVRTFSDAIQADTSAALRRSISIR